MKQQQVARRKKNKNAVEKMITDYSIREYGTMLDCLPPYSNYIYGTE